MGDKQVVVFRLNKEEYGIEITEVQEIVRYQEVTNIPEAPDFVKGIINLRGKVIPVIDLKYRFYNQNSVITEESRIIVIKVEDSILGIIADNVSEVLRVPEEDIESTTLLIGNMGGISAIGKLEGRLLMFLDLKKALSAEELFEIDQVS